MMKLTTADTARYLLERDSFCIITHRRPDGDTLGSAAALCRGLRQKNKAAYILENPEITPKYANLLEGLCKPVISKDDTLVFVDLASANMYPASFVRPLENPSLRIDHHRTSDSFTDAELVDPDSAACGELIYDLLTEMDVALDIPMANALYTAISTDTGCFRFANTQSHTFEVAAACAKVTPDLYTLNQTLFGTVSFARLKIQSWMIENAKFLAGGQIAICALPLTVEKELGVTEDDMENISGFPRSIDGVKIAATLRQQEDGLVKLSVRCAPDFDAGAICAKFGGGGHRGAAGANLNLSLEEATNAVIAAMPTLE